MDKYDPSQFTEFPRFEPESSQSGVSTFFNKLWKFPIFSPSEGESMQNKALTDDKENAPLPQEQNKPEEDDSKTETGSCAVEYEGRSLPNVLKRISSLVALGSGGGTRYADTELARYWMPDDISRECYECATRFSALRRRHHCRVCGQIFCSRCCSQRVPGQIFGCAGGLRVCNYCCNVVLTYLRENDMTGEMSTDLRTLQESLQVKFPENKSQPSIKTRDNFTFAREADERGEVRVGTKEALQDVFRQLSFTLPTQQHRYRLVRYNGVWRGCDVLQWVIDNTSNKTRAQASLICQSLLNAGYMECTTELPQFADYALYKPITLPPITAHEQESPEECTRIVESVSSYCLDLNLGENSARLIKAQKTEVKSSPSSEEDSPVPVQSEGHRETKKISKAILELGEDHLRLLLRQCLARSSLSASWFDIIYQLCQQSAELVTTDVYSNDIDVRNYVQVKKVPGDSPRDSCVVQGVVITKNVVHRAMPQQISNPTVLLLDCSIAYHRVEGKLTSLEPVLMQEKEYLRRCAARITTLQPRVVLVRGSVARGVQDALRAEGVALASAVRERAMRRAARCARAELVTSIDARIGMPRLGTCSNFYIKTYPSKTLMVLEGCAEPQLGCCILLRGESLTELVRVKKVVKFMLLAFYNWKLERAFLGDIEAVIPASGMTFDDDNDVFDEKTDANQDNDDLNTSAINDQSDSVYNESVSKINTSHDEKLQSDDKEAKTCDENAKSCEAKIQHKLNDSNDSNRNRSDIDDPLQKAKFVRKTDSDKTLSCGVPVGDFSDPLRATLSVDDDVFMPKEEAKLQADYDHDRWSSDDAVLSMSPNVIIPAPYLETEAGRKCPLRVYFPRPLLTIPARAPHTPRAGQRKYSRPIKCNVTVKEAHPFIRNPITTLADDPGFRALLAHYRATGCSLINNNHSPGCPLYNPTVVKTFLKDPSDRTEPLDPLAPENHQRLSLLLYSYSNKSANVPDFCVNPWIATMEMYGKHDISLGAFLEKYCFNGEQKCTSDTCQVPINQHVRRFVHGDVCITITCNTVGHSNVDKIKEENSKQVMFWSRCEQCSAVGGAARLSRSALAMSLAVYLRMRALSPRPARRACAHALHTHAHAFVSRLTTACFRYNKISTFDIKLPPDVIHTRYDTKHMRDSLINQLNELILKGHETFTGVSDSEAEKDHQSFKLHMDQIHLALTSSHLQEANTPAAVIRSLWSVSDRIISGEKMLRDALEKWSSPAKPAKMQTDTNIEEKPEIEERKEESPGDAGNNDNSGSTTYVFTDNSSKDSEKEPAGTEEDEEKGDKKTVRQILSQLLSNNQPSNQSGMIISGGLVPVVVQPGEIGSVIAATLASVTYQRTLRTQRYGRPSAQTESETKQEAENSTNKDKSETDKSKAAKSNDHIEVLLKDGLLCRVYYAPQFQKLRHLMLSRLNSNPHISDEFLTSSHSDSAADKCSCEDAKDKTESRHLCDIEEGFIRSLAYCVPWAAKGGKSGSTFCKTRDDRYVLKEMTKAEWQQFLEFAPHYFNYVTNCRLNRLPSLLARILGVYSVGGAGNGVLVMENIWYGCPADAKRFDLKGSSRHRLTADNQPLAVLMDENLLNLRWETPLYIHSHTGSVLWKCIERDTEFLASNSVMDYSLLLGIDKQTLVLGVIDYIRTFTWDKKLEHLVKKNLGGGQPTVVSPEEYKRRFSTACRKYFLQCPQHWDHLYHTTLA